MAHSTISIMRETSACASGYVLPISRVAVAAISSARLTSCSRKPNSQRARSMVLRAFHAGKAARAACTAASTSLAPDSGTWARTSPVAGLVMSISSELVDGTQPPLM